jgi:hypothetical protein
MRSARTLSCLFASGSLTTSSSFKELTAIYFASGELKPQKHQGLAL